MVVPIIFASLGCLSLVWFLFEKIKAYSIKAVLIKALTSSFFVAVGIYALCTTHLKFFSTFAVVGLILGMAGDIFLDLKYAKKEKDYEFTVAGFIAFGLGHIMYITGMYLEFFRDQSILYLIIPLAIGCLMGPCTILMGKVLKTEYGRLKIIAGAYAVILFSMVACSFSVYMMMDFKNTGLMMVFIGGVLFAVSDLILNMTYFGKGHEKPFDIISNTITYYAAQFVIAFAIMLM